MVELFRHQSAARHKAEGLIEIREHKFFSDCVTAFDLAPAVQPCKRVTACLAGNFLRHWQTPYVKRSRNRPFHQ